MDYRNRVVIITGASSGIGEHLAVEFASRGASIVICARRAERLHAVSNRCSKHGHPVEAIVGDLATPGFAAELVDRAVSRFGRLDIVVNNAGVSKHKYFYDVTADDISSTMDINFRAPAFLTLAAVPVFLRQGGGSIVNISSVAGRLAPPHEAVYAASKFALTGFSEGLAVDLAGSGIHTGVIHVGPIDTEIWEKAEIPESFNGKKYPPSSVSDAVFRCIERKRHSITVPWHFSLIFFLKSLLPGLFRWGTVRFDPVAAEVIERARQAAISGAKTPGSESPAPCKSQDAPESSA